MSAEILAAISVAMLALGSMAIIAVMVGLTWNMLNEGWVRRPAPVRAQRPTVQPTDRTQPIRRAA